MNSSLAVLSLAVLVAIPNVASATNYTVPDLTLPQVKRISDGAILNPAAIQPAVSGLSAIGVPTMLSYHPEITGVGQTVVVIDTGLDYTHSALSSNYLTGYDFTTNTANPMDNWAGGGGHGTHVSGIIASSDPLHPGVAPGVNIIGLKVFDSTTGQASDTNVLAALQWVSDHKAQYNITAVNMSLGDSVESTWASIPANDPFDASLLTLKNKGVFVAVASGNDAFLHGQSMPAASRHAVSVGATYASNDWDQYVISSPGSLDPYQWPDANNILRDATDLDYGPIKNDIAFFTNRYKSASDGGTTVMAPGIFITSSIPLALDTDDGIQDGWTDLAGTSMAAPHVTAASILVRQALEEAGLLDPDPAKQVDQILNILEQTGTPLYDAFYYFGGNNSTIMELPPGSGDYQIRPSTFEDYTLIDVNAAVTSILGVPEPASITLLASAALPLLLKRRCRRIKSPG